jgi:DNA-binding Lrp family transcriptional regulator
MRRPADRPVDLSLDELRVLARLEGKPLPRGPDLADVLGLSPNAAWRRIRDLRRRGVLAFVSPVRLPEGMCECVTYLKINGAHVGSLDRLDEWIAADPATTAAATVTGVYDYRLVSMHRDLRSANDWSRRLEARPEVAEVRTSFCSILFERHAYAAAILGTGPSRAASGRKG